MRDIPRNNHHGKRKPPVRRNAAQQSWFRSYRSKLWNPKTRRLSDALYRKWDYALCMTDARGFLPKLADIAFHWGVSDNEAQTIICDLVELQLVDAIGLGMNCQYRIHDWDDWQSYSDTTATDRQRAHRARNGNVTAMSRQCHGNRSVSVSASVTSTDRTQRQQEVGDGSSRLVLGDTGDRYSTAAAGDNDYDRSDDDMGVL